MNKLEINFDSAVCSAFEKSSFQIDNLPPKTIAPHQESQSSNSSGALRRKMRAETQYLNNVQALQCAKADVKMPNENIELTHLFVKYGNNPDGIPALLYAIKSNDLNAVRIFLENGASPNTRISHRNGPTYNHQHSPSNGIEYAAAYSSAPMIALLEAYGASCQKILSEADDQEQKNVIQSPISIAAAFDNVEAIKYFLSSGCSVHESIYNHISNVACQAEGTPIFIAAQSGSLNAFKYLMSVGANVSKQEDGLFLTSIQSNKNNKMVQFILETFSQISSQALDNAISIVSNQGNVESIKLLINKGANLSSAFNVIYQDIQYCPNKYSIIELLLSSGLDPKKPFNGQLPISYATQRGDINLAKLLLKYGAELNPKFLQNPLQTVSVYQYPEMVQFLVDAGVPVNQAYDGGMTPILYASMLNNPNAAIAIDILLKAGANINAANTQGWTPLHYACNMGHEQTVIKLLQKGANINATIPSGWQTPPKPFHFIQNATFETIKALILKGADLNESNGYRPIFHDLASRTDAAEIFTFLANNKININAKDKAGQTIFHSAVERGNINLIEVLFKIKADINIKDNQGKTPLAIAKLHRQELVAWLMEHGAI